MRKTPAVLVGKAIGDALGMPFEALGNKVHAGLATWDGTYQPGTWHKLPAGHWTDDTELAVALAESLIETDGAYDPELTARKYLAWAEATPHGMGSTTKIAMDRLREGVSWNASGVEIEDPAKVGAGTVMRIAPLILVGGTRNDLIRDASITHRSHEAWVANLIIAWQLNRLLEAYDENKSANGWLTKAFDWKALKPIVEGTLVNDLFEKAVNLYKDNASFAEAIKVLGNRGNAAQITATAWFCAAKATTFEEGVQEAVRGGADADTRAAVAGALLGARFGSDGIPDHYKQGLNNFTYLQELDDKLFWLRLENSKK